MQIYTTLRVRRSQKRIFLTYSSLSEQTFEKFFFCDLLVHDEGLQVYLVLVWRFYGIVFADLRVVSGARAYFSFQCFVIHFNQTKTRPEAFVPLEVVEKRPVEIAFDFGTVFDRAVDGGNRACQEFFSEGVISVSEAVFGDVDGFIVWLQFDKRVVDGLGMKFPAEISEALVWIFVETIVDDVSAVVIESDEILMIFDAIEEPSIPEGMCDCFECTIYERIFSEFK